MRYTQPGWKLLQLGDVVAQRRGIWLRLTDTHVEFCGGREGDDLFFQIPLREGNPERGVWEGLYQQAAWHYDTAIDELRDMDDAQLAAKIREWLGALDHHLNSGNNNNEQSSTPE